LSRGALPGAPQGFALDEYSTRFWYRLPNFIFDPINSVLDVSGAETGF
jgi:hypothetical protein